jgi:tetratricopeptide (TPR) repeat protein
MNFSFRFFLILFFTMCVSVASYATTQDAIKYRSQGQKALQLGELDKAIEFFKKSCKKDPEYALAHNDLGVVYELKGIDNQAELEYKKALKIDPKLASAHMNLALLYEKIGKREQAVEHIVERIRLGSPDDPWTQKAWEALWRNSPETAEKMKKEMADRYCEKASSYFKKNDYEKSAFWFKHACQLVPDNKLYQELYKKAEFEVKYKKINQLVKEGLESYKASNFARAKESFGKILELIPTEE